jgi:hypothetical protein
MLPMTFLDASGLLADFGMAWTSDLPGKEWILPGEGGILTLSLLPLSRRRMHCML